MGTPVLLRSAVGRGAGVVERDGLENRCTSSRYRGFESHPLRSRWNRRRSGPPLGVRRSATVAALLVFLLYGSVRAQSFYDVIYRPAWVKYDVLETENFELIFQRGLDTLVYEAAITLEKAYEEIRAETGFDRPFSMPVVLNNFSDVSNGFVTAAPFRQEITAAPIKGQSAQSPPL